MAEEYTATETESVISSRHSGKLAFSIYIHICLSVDFVLLHLIFVIFCNPYVLFVSP